MTRVRASGHEYVVGEVILILDRTGDLVCLANAGQGRICNMFRLSWTVFNDCTIFMTIMRIVVVDVKVVWMIAFIQNDQPLSFWKLEQHCERSDPAHDQVFPTSLLGKSRCHGSRADLREKERESSKGASGQDTYV